MLTAVPPLTWPMVRVAPLGVNGEAGSASRSSRSDSSTRWFISLMATMLAETPRWVRLEWASRPVTVTRKLAMPLWPRTATMSVGSPTTTRAGRGSSLGDHRDHVRRAQAADFLVIGEGQVDGAVEGGLGQVRRGGQGQGQEALHVAGPPAVEPAVARGQDERVAGPGLAVDRHHVGMARQHDAARDGRADAGQQVALGPVGVGHPPRGDAEIGQIGLDPFDQGQVGQPRGGVEGHQGGEDVDGAGGQDFGRRDFEDGTMARP
jgi:hypothetical protein